MKHAYPVWFNCLKGKSFITVPDFGMEQEIDGSFTIADLMNRARAMMETAAKNLRTEGKDLPEPGNVEYKKARGEIFSYVDVNLSGLEKRKTLEELEQMEASQVNEMWDVRENVFEFLLNQKILTATVTQKRLINRIRRYAAEHPEEVKILRENEDGSIYAKLPVRYLRISRPVERVLTEEELEASRNRLREIRERKAAADAEQEG